MSDLITWLHKWLTSSVRQPKARIAFWFVLSLTMTAIYSFLALQKAFAGEYVVQDDARQHVFWMQRFVEPALFPNDLIADYFQSVAPTGYRWLYYIAAAWGIDPLFFSKLLPLPLSLITAGYCFGACLELFPLPAAAFSTTLLLSQALSMTDAVVSGTPKAFIYPLFLAFIYYLLRESLLLCVVIALLGLFYPQMVLVAGATLLLRLWEWQSGRLHRVKWQRQLLYSAGLGVAFLSLLPYALSSNQFGPVITAAEARQLPEFFPGGRADFFNDDEPIQFWLEGRSGIRVASALTPMTNVLGFLLLLLPHFPRRFPLVKLIRPQICLLVQILVASVSVFFLAHALLFRLHLPSRYTGHSLRIVLTLSAGMVLLILLDAVLRWAQHRQDQVTGSRYLVALGTTALMGAALLLYPAFVKHFPITAHIKGNMPSLYEFFQQQPPASLIASLSDEANNLPTFAHRSILVGSEYAIPYHLGYYHQFKARSLDLITAHFSANPQVVKRFIRKYGIDFWLLNRHDFTLEFLDDSWLEQYQPATNQAIAQLQAGKQPALETVLPSCTVFSAEPLVVLDANCLLQTLK